MIIRSERDHRLDQLVELTKQWSQQRQKELNARVQVLTRILEGRGAGQLLSATQEAATKLVVDEIDKFLVGE